jgi:hypothetical protein
MAYPTMAAPRSSADQISPSTPPVLVTGAEPKNPVKKRVIIMVWISLAVAVPNENIAAIK